MYRDPKFLKFRYNIYMHCVLFTCNLRNGNVADKQLVERRIKTKLELRLTSTVLFANVNKRKWQICEVLHTFFSMISV